MKSIWPCRACYFEHIEDERYGEYIICPHCGWEDDPVQFKDPNFAGGANELSLNVFIDTLAQRTTPKKYTVDLSSVQNLNDFYQVVKTQLNLPDYCGSNFNALDECISEMVGPINVEVKKLPTNSFEELQTNFENLISEINEERPDLKFLFHD